MKNKVILGVFLMIILAIAAVPALATQALNITTPSLEFKGSAGSQSQSFLIKNIGTEVINLTFTVSAPSAGGRTAGVALSQNTIKMLMPGVTTSITATANLTNYVGIYVGAISASVDNIPPFGDAVDTMPVTVNVTDNGLGLLSASPLPISTEPDKTATQTITVQNLANRDITASVQKSGFAEMSSFNLDKIGTVIFPALSTTTITSTIAVPAGLASATYWGFVNISYDAGSLPLINLQANVLPTQKLSISTVTMTDLDPGSSKDISFSINNNGNINLTGISIQNLSLSDNDGDKINVSFSPSSAISVNVGSSASITAHAVASNKIDPGTYTAQASVSGPVTQSFTISIAISPMLQITEVEVDPEEVMPGEEFSVDVTVENTAEDMDLEDVEVEVFVMDGTNVLEDQDDDEVKDDIEIGDLSDGDEQKVTIKLTMPYNTEDGDIFTIKVVAKGENADDSSEKYEDVDTSQTIDVERDDHKVDLYSIDLQTSTLSCARTTYIELGMKDIGANDEDVILTIKNDQIGLRVQDNFEMSSDYDDDEFDVEKSYQLDFSSAPAGSYPVVVLVENEDEDKLADGTATITIQDCTANPTQPTTPSTPTTPTTPTTTGTTGTTDVVYTGAATSVMSPTVPAVSAATAIKKVKTGTWTDSALGMAILVLGNLLLLLLVVIAFMYMLGSFSGKKETF